MKLFINRTMFHCREELFLRNESHLNAFDIAQKWPAGVLIMRQFKEASFLILREITLYNSALRMERKNSWLHSEIQRQYLCNLHDIVLVSLRANNSTFIMSNEIHFVRKFSPSLVRASESTVAFHSIRDTKSTLKFPSSKLIIIKDAS